MNFSEKISSTILLMIIICNEFSNGEIIPEFCYTPKIDGIFNFGYEYRLRYDKWIWTYDYDFLKMIEPPMKESVFTGKNDIESLRVLTTLFISRVAVGPPDRPCMEGMNKTECDKQRKAMDLLFTRFLDTKTDIEFTDVVRVNGTLQNISTDEYPWNLGPDGDVWPQDWNNDKYNTRPSAYSPDTMQSYFIIHSGDSDLSELLYNRIITNDWYKHWSRDPIKSDVKFVGMFFFHLTKSVYAVGDRALHGDRVSRMYILTKSTDGHFFFKDMNQEVRSFFNCKNMVTKDSETSKFLTTTETHGEEEVNNKAQNNSIVYIVIAGIASIFVIALIVIIIVFVVIKVRSGRQTYKVSETFRDLDDDRTSSIITINSDSGQPSRHSQTYSK